MDSISDSLYRNNHPEITFNFSEYYGLPWLSIESVDYFSVEQVNVHMPWLTFVKPRGRPIRDGSFCNSETGIFQTFSPLVTS